VACKTQREGEKKQETQHASERERTNRDRTSHPELRSANERERVDSNAPQTAIEPHTQSSDPANEREKVDSNAPARRSRRREIAQLIAISPSTEIAIDGAISRRVDRDLAPLIAIDGAISRSVDREIAPSPFESHPSSSPIANPDSSSLIAAVAAPIRRPRSRWSHPKTDRPPSLPSSLNLTGI